MRLYSEYTKLSGDLSVVEGPGGVLLVGTPQGTYAYLSEEQEADPKYLKFYPVETFKRFVPLETNIYKLPNIPTQESQKAWATRGNRIITHVLRSEDDKVRLAFGGTEDPLPILVVAGGAYRQYNNVDPGAVLTGFEREGADIRMYSVGSWDQNSSKLQVCSAVHKPDYKGKWGEHIETTRVLYRDELNAKRAEIAEKLYTGELTRGNIGIFRVLDGLFYYDDTTTLKVITTDLKKTVYAKLASVTTDSFYEALYAICEPQFLRSEVGFGVPLELEVSGTAVTVEIRQGKARIDDNTRQELWYINGKKITRDDYRPVLERITCYPEATDAYMLYVEQVARISLYYHNLNDEGLDFKLGRAQSGNRLLAQAYEDMGVPVKDRRSDVPEVSKSDYVFPIPEYQSHGGGRNGVNRGGSTFSLNVKFRKQKATEKPQIFLLGKWRTLLKGSSVVKSLKGYLADDYSTNFANNRDSLNYCVSNIVENFKIKKGDAYLNGIYNAQDTDLKTDEHKRIAAKFSKFSLDSDNNAGYIKSLVGRLYKIDSALVAEDRIFRMGGTAKGIDLSVPSGAVKDEYSADVMKQKTLNTVLDIYLPWWERVMQNIVSPFSLLAADQVVAVGDSLKKSEEILLAAIKQTKAEHISKGHNKKHYVKVTGHSGTIYWICINDGRVALNKRKGVGSDNITDEPGAHICIVRASNAEYAGHDYVASLVFALHSDSRTAGKIYTVDNLLKKNK